MARASRRVALGGAAIVAATLLESAMLAWSGQPETGATDAVVADYYSHHWVAVVVGNLLWLPGTVLLWAVALLGLREHSRGSPRILHRTTVMVIAAAGALMVVSSAFALVTVVAAKAGSTTATGTVWSAKVGSFTVAMLCWMVGAALFAVTRARTDRLTAGLAAAAAVLLLLGGDVGWWALLGAIVMLGATMPRAMAPDRMTPWTSDWPAASMSSLVGRGG